MLNCQKDRKIPPGWDTRKLKLKQRYTILAGRRVPPELLKAIRVAGKKLAQAYAGLGGNKALKNLVASLKREGNFPEGLDIGKLKKRQRYAILAEGRVPPEFVKLSREQRQKAYEELGGDQALGELLTSLEKEGRVSPGLTLDMLTPRQRYRVLTRRRVPATVMKALARKQNPLSKEDLLKKAYEDLGGDEKLQEKLEVQDPAAFTTAQKFEFLSRGYIPAAHAKAAWGVDGAVEKLGGDKKLQGMGVRPNATLSPEEKLQILREGEIPEVLLENAFGGPAGLEAGIKALLTKIGLDPSLSDHVPPEKRLAILRTAHFPDPLLKTFKLGGPAGLRAAVVAKVKDWLKKKSMDENLADDLAARIKDAGQQLKVVEQEKFPPNFPQKAKNLVKKAKVKQHGGPAGLRAEVLLKVQAWLGQHSIDADLADDLVATIKTEEDQLEVVENNQFPSRFDGEANARAKIKNLGGEDKVKGLARQIFTNEGLMEDLVDRLSNPALVEVVETRSAKAAQDEIMNYLYNNQTKMAAGVKRHYGGKVTVPDDPRKVWYAFKDDDQRWKVLLGQEGPEDVKRSLA